MIKVIYGSRHLLSWMLIIMALVCTRTPLSAKERSSHVVAPSGASETSSSAYVFNCINDSQAVGGLGFGACLQVTQTFGGSVVTGGRNAASFYTILQEATSQSNPNRNYVGGVLDAEAKTSDGGRRGAEQGAVFGANLVAHLDSNAVEFLDLAGAEVNYGIDHGGSSRLKYGLDIVNDADHVHASVEEAAIAVGSQKGSLPLGVGFLLSDANGQFPISRDGTVFGSSAGKVAMVFDFSKVDSKILLKGNGDIEANGEVRSRKVSASLAMVVPFGAPASAMSECVPGQIQIDEVYIYSCVSKNRWHRTVNGERW